MAELGETESQLLELREAMRAAGYDADVEVAPNGEVYVGTSKENAWRWADAWWQDRHAYSPLNMDLDTATGIYRLRA